MTGRGDLILAFATATAVHASAFAVGLPRTGGDGSGEGGTNRLSIAAASHSVAAMVRSWETSPEIAEPTELNMIVAEPESQVAMLRDVKPAQLTRPNQPNVVETPSHRPILPTDAPTPPRVPPIVPDAGLVAQMAALPGRLSVPHLPSPTILRAEPSLQTVPPSADLAPLMTERPLARPADTDAPAVARQLASGAGDAGLRGSARTTPAPKHSGADRRAAASAWAAEIQRRIARHHVYPRNSRDEGRVRVAMVILPSGKLSGVSVAQSSGSASLDKAAIAAVKRAAPFPPAPAALNDGFFNVGQWISFKQH